MWCIHSLHPFRLLDYDDSLFWLAGCQVPTWFLQTCLLLCAKYYSSCHGHCDVVIWSFDCRCPGKASFANFDPFMAESFFEEINEKLGEVQMLFRTSCFICRCRNTFQKNGVKVFHSKPWDKWYFICRCRNTFQKEMAKCFILFCKTLDRRYVPSYVRKYNIFSWEELAREVSIWRSSGSQEVARDSRLVADW